VTLSDPADVGVVKAVAAAILTFGSLPANIAAQVLTTDQKFVVHPHVADVATNDRLLLSYLRSIYTSPPALQTAYPAAQAFAQLNSSDSLKSATRSLADALAVEMSRRNANAGILFGFILRRSDGSEPHGVIKADLDDEERFHMEVAADGSWTWDSVSDLLPHPRTEFAKFAIAPQPGGVGLAGIRDVVEKDAAVAYFLAALKLSVPKTSGTQTRVAAAALKAGYTLGEITTAFRSLTTETPVEDFVREQFPRVPDTEVNRLPGRPERPMLRVLPQDPFLRIYKTRRPRFQLIVDETVGVEIAGRVITVRLPPGDQIEYDVHEP
jgi:hypothetical protein